MFNKLTAIKAFPADLYQLFSQYHGDIIFEWTLENDRFFVSANWFDRFGYVPSTCNFSQSFPISSHIHPEDIAILESFTDMLLNTPPDTINNRYYSSLKLRIKTVYNEYLDCTLRTLAFFDDDNRLLKVSGLIAPLEADNPPAADNDELQTALLKNSVKTAATHSAGAEQMAASKFDVDLFFSAYNNIDTFIFAVSNDNHEIVFANRALCAFLHYDPTGRKCFAAFHHFEQPCEKCPMTVLSADIRRAHKETFNKSERRWYRITASRLPQLPDSDISLVQVQDITEKKELSFMPMY